MEKIASFTIDHIKLEPGIYVSRKDTVGAEVITMLFTVPKLFILVRWDAVPDFICFSQVIMNQRTLLA